VWISAIAFSPEYAIDHTLWIGTDNGLFRSTNGGISWSRSDNGLPGEADVPIAVLSISVSPKFASDHTLFAATSIGGLYVSHDGGTHWAAVH
ncbi:MAG TPA: hypothetical protein VFK30_02630, partial [Anaerolineae bacterium]|nr:hypothetical protein [Anaerolineae bacterium]